MIPSVDSSKPEIEGTARIHAVSICARLEALELLRVYPIATLASFGVLVALALWLMRSTAGSAVLVAVAIGCGLPLIAKTLWNMAHGRFYVDTVAALAIICCIALREWTAGALVVLMQSGGEALEDYGLRRASRSLDNLLRRAPSVAHCRRGADFVDVTVAELVVGDVILIRAGDIIPADGVVTEGRGNVDESALTGEPVPLAKLPGDKVFSGTINLSGIFEVQTTQIAAQSKYELIVRMVKEAQGARAPVNRLANQYTPVFTLFTLGSAAAVLLLTGSRVRALSVLVVATPCPLIIATPLAVLSAINRAAALNIIAKSGASLEQAGAVTTVVFDKTGTLTSGAPTLCEIRLNKTSGRCIGEPNRLLQYAANVEMLSTHVLATAVVEAARDRVLTISPASNICEAPGSGIAGITDGKSVAIGSSAFLESQGVIVPEAAKAERVSISAQGKSVAYIGVEGHVAGFLIFEDRVRSEAPATVMRLQELGVTQLVLLTGDAPETAHAVAAQVGIARVCAHMQPEDKLSTIRELATRGAVMMVGDGINDAPALAASSVGVALGGHGAGIATDAADIVITVENMQRVADVISIGRNMVRVARTGILVGMGASLILMGCAGLGLFTPPTGALLQEVIDLAAIANALRVR